MFRGVMVLVDGLRLLLIRGELRALLWRMLGLLVVMMLLLSVGVFNGLEYLAAQWIPEGDAWYWMIVGWFAWLFALLLSMVTAAVVFITLGTAAMAPWLDELARRTEAIEGKPLSESQGSWMTMVMQSLLNSLRPLLELLLWGIAALLFFWLPPLATLIWGIGTARYLTYELIDTAASRRDWNFAARRQQIASARWFYLGFALAALLLLLVPLVNLLVIPAAVVGISRYYMRSATVENTESA